MSRVNEPFMTEFAHYPPSKSQKGNIATRFAKLTNGIRRGTKASDALSLRTKKKQKIFRTIDNTLMSLCVAGGEGRENMAVAKTRSGTSIEHDYRSPKKQFKPPIQDGGAADRYAATRRRLRLSGGPRLFEGAQASMGAAARPLSCPGPAVDLRPVHVLL